jgi:type IX secretion system substrate protein
MKKLLLVLGILALSFGGYAQSGQDFSSFGNELLVQKNKVEIYPNPSVDYLNVQIENSDLSKTVLIVHNIIGSKIEITAEKVGADQYRLDVRDLPKGYYLLSIKDATSNFSKTFKFLKR